MATPTIADIWTYYSDTYGGILSEEEFTKIAIREEMLLTELINGKTVPDNMEDRYKMAMCELIDYEKDTTSADQAGIVETETIDGYSIKYRETGFEEQRQDQYKIATKYLTYPVNLMYCGVEYKCLRTET